MEAGDKEAKEAAIKKLQEQVYLFFDIYLDFLNLNILQAKSLTEQNTSAQTEARNAKKKLADTGKELASLRKQIEEKNAELRAAQDMMAQVQKEAKEAGAKTRQQGQNLAPVEQKSWTESNDGPHLRTELEQKSWTESDDDPHLQIW